LHLLNSFVLARAQLRKWICRDSGWPQRVAEFRRGNLCKFWPGLRFRSAGSPGRASNSSPLSGNFLKNGTLRVLVYVVDHFRQVTRRYCSRRFSQSREYFGNFGMAARPRVQPGEKLRLVFRTELIARGHEVDCRFVLHSFSVTRCPWR